MTRSAVSTVGMQPSGVLARRCGAVGLAALCALAPLALPSAGHAQGTATPATTAPATAPAAGGAAAADPVVATVNGQPITLRDLQDAAASLPPTARGMPKETLYPLLLEQLIDGRALVAEAQKDGLAQQPDVQRKVKAAEDQALQTALLQKEVAPLVTEEAVRAKYEKDVAGKPGEMEVHARHILVPDEATAKKIIAELKKGGDFAALSKQYSKDPGAAQQGGDLGFFKREDMVPEFAKAAFALKDGEISPEPVHTQFGWHVIQTLEHRQSPPPSFDEAKAELRQQMIQDAVKQVVAKARADVKVQTFNLDGSQKRATDSAEPPPSTKP
ncbi:MAG: peptidylprolyl isomerase [Rhodospirillales bacterium]|nr:peptidylprolyl isomerase [Rhodospirillales bacterium]